MDAIIIGAHYMLLEMYRIEIVCYFLDLNCEDKSFGNQSFEDKNIKLKLNCIELAMYLQILKVDQDTLNINSELHEDFLELLGYLISNKMILNILIEFFLFATNQIILMYAMACVYMIFSDNIQG